MNDELVEKLEVEVADKLAEFFKDPIDKDCSYCEASRAIIPIIQADTEAKMKEIERAHVANAVSATEFRTQREIGEEIENQFMLTDDIIMDRRAYVKGLKSFVKALKSGTWRQRNGNSPAR